MSRKHRIIALAASVYCISTISAYAAPIPPFEKLSAILQERVTCSVAAAAKYDIPANILLAIAEKEGGQHGQWIANTNGTYDIGPMQFNTVYLADLEKHGITTDDVAAAGCYPYELAAWRIRGHLLNDKGDMWTRAANYHSRTPEYNFIYREDIMEKAARWADWLAGYVMVLDDSAEPKTIQVSHATY